MSVMTGDPVLTLFVYGTLQPGDARWHHLEPFAADEGTPDAIDGQLFDTGCGYPAALLDHRAEPGHTVVGRRFALRADLIEEALVVLDTVESSVAGLYRRVRVTTHAGVDAWAYEYGAGLTLTPIESGDWSDR
jgi:gamma-glutamylcyclotransferase (GGCT)/AIG2-like uncharacterized protein YtfP